MDWDKTLTFTVPMHGEARYTFDYLTSTYDSKAGKLLVYTNNDRVFLKCKLLNLTSFTIIS